MPRSAREPYERAPDAAQASPTTDGRRTQRGVDQTSRPPPSGAARPRFAVGNRCPRDGTSADGDDYGRALGHSGTRALGHSGTRALGHSGTRALGRWLRSLVPEGRSGPRRTAPAREDGKPPGTPRHRSRSAVRHGMRLVEPAEPVSGYPRGNSVLKSPRLPVAEFQGFECAVYGVDRCRFKEPLKLGRTTFYEGFPFRRSSDAFRPFPGNGRSAVGIQDRFRRRSGRPARDHTWKSLASCGGCVADDTCAFKQTTRGRHCDLSHNDPGALHTSAPAPQREKSTGASSLTPHSINRLLDTQRALARHDEWGFLSSWPVPQREAFPYPWSV
jgi:hypothetical protein